MSELYLWTAVFLFLNILAGLFIIVRNNIRINKLLAAQLFGTTGVAVMLLLSFLLENSYLKDIALVYSILAIVSTSAFIRQDIKDLTN